MSGYDAALSDRQRALTAVILGLEDAPADEMAVVRLVRGRLRTQAIGALQAAGLDAKSLTRIIPRRTLEHRRQKGEALSLEESERAYRTASIVALAEAVFGNRDKALAWLNAPKPRFDDEAPMDLVDTEIGARLVEEALIQIDEGYFA
ncbi:type II RES/Xre toxin-antitoxin system antitoxin [Azospirillum canadense]|uniref:type II RES/Xre toxin-antitoxin system antitoxin n=1 Tax=Azospirillum canadense TaxID=403962 RepID=UPI0022260E9F|nr:antitoxin Xre/MbcA/ParS toxin-binding domain-containing protein [Azospirillum canadense]MCW2238464.1 putative toxin-antitoxin system antitoxin component (TIGR02293 family) [Azospirillum canadense]